MLSIEIDGSQNQSQQSSAIRYQLGFLSRDYSAKISWPCSAYDHNQQFPSHDQHSLLVLAVATQTHSHTHNLDKHMSGRMHLSLSADVQDFVVSKILLVIYGEKPRVRSAHVATNRGWPNWSDLRSCTISSPEDPIWSYRAQHLWTYCAQHGDQTRNAFVKSSRQCEWQGSTRYNRGQSEMASQTTAASCIRRLSISWDTQRRVPFV